MVLDNINPNKAKKCVRNMTENAHRRVRFILISIVRVLLVIAFAFALFEGRRVLMFATSVLFVFTLLPSIFGFFTKKDSSVFFDVMVLFLVFGALSYLEIRGEYANFDIFAVSMNLAQAIAIGFLGLTLVYAFFKYVKLEENVFMVSVFAFCFSFSLGIILELGEIVVDEVLGFNIHSSGVFGTTGDLLTYFGGCIFISLIGYVSLKNGKVLFVSTVLEKFVENNPRLFGLKLNDDNHPDKIKELVKKGEHQKLEFKATLRKNLHTNQFDRQMEHSVMKTVSAYLNSEGGTLLVGVNDKGEIIGVEQDQFQNKDQINRHLNNLLMNHIGAEFMPFIKTDIIEIDNKNVIKVDCRRSNKEVFVKQGNEEEFYVRRGSLSMPLSGSSLLKYIENKFRKKNFS